MFRNLEAIEIAEGALLADIAVIFQFIAAFLPIGSSFFHMLTIIAFSVLVLRRGLYIGLMGVCVAVCVISILIGPSYLLSMLTEGLAGSFLGITMKLRFHHFPLLVSGILSGSLFLYVAVILLTLLAGASFDDIIHSLHQGYDTVISVLSLLTTRVGLGTQWRQQMYPQVALFSTYAFTYWWLTLYVALCLVLSPIVTAAYLVANSFVRLLGYDVRPFPGGRLNTFLYHISRRLFKLGIKWGLVKRT